MGYLNLNRRKSFENLMMWLEEARGNCHKEISIILVGNKTDMENEYIMDYYGKRS